MGLKAGLNLFQKCTQYAKLCGKDSILQTLPKDLAKVDTCRLKFAPKIEGDVLELGAKATKVRARLSEQEIKALENYQKRAVELEQSVKDSLQSQGVFCPPGRDLLQVFVGSNVRELGNFDPETGKRIVHNYEELAEYYALKKHIRRFDASELKFDAQKLKQQHDQKLQEIMEMVHRRRPNNIAEKVQKPMGTPEVKPNGKKIRTVKNQTVKLSDQVAKRCKAYMKKHKIKDEQDAARKMLEEELSKREIFYTHRSRINGEMTARLKAISIEAENVEIARNTSKLFFERAQLPNSLIQIEEKNPSQMSVIAGFVPLSGKFFIRNDVPKEYVKQLMAHETDHCIKFIRLAKTLGIDKFKEAMFKQNREALCLNLKQSGQEVNERNLRELFERQFNTEYWTTVVNDAKVKPFSKRQVTAFTEPYSLPKSDGNFYEQISSFVSYFTHPLEKSAYALQVDVANALSQVNMSGSTDIIYSKIKDLLSQLEKTHGNNEARRKVGNICRTLGVDDLRDPFQAIKLFDALKAIIV